MSLRPELNITQSGDEYQLQMITPHMTKTVAFKNGDTVDQTSIVGRTVKVQSFYNHSQAVSPVLKVLQSWHPLSFHLDLPSEANSLFTILHATHSQNYRMHLSRQ